MGVPETLLESVVAYCSAQDGDEDDLRNINEAWDGAAAYLKGAGVAAPQETDERWPLWFEVMKGLTLDGFDQRGAQFEQGKLADNRSFRRKLNQLKFASLPDVSDSDTQGGTA